MPIDEEKSNQNWRVYKNTCVCGSTESIPVLHDEGTAPTKEALEEFNRKIAKPLTPTAQEGTQT